MSEKTPSPDPAAPPSAAKVEAEPAGQARAARLRDWIETCKTSDSPRTPHELAEKAANAARSVVRRRGKP